MAKKNAELETVKSMSGAISISQQSFSSHFKGLTAARDSKSFSAERSHQSNHKVPAWTGALKKVFKTYDKKSRRHEFCEWSLEEGRYFIMELAKELNRGWENPIIPSNVTGEEVCSLEECRSFIVKWADELDKLYQNAVMPSNVSSEEMCNLEECRSFIMKWADELDKLNEGAEGEEQRLKEGQHIIMEWARELKRVPEVLLTRVPDPYKIHQLHDCTFLGLTLERVKQITSRLNPGI
ncbi:uncharacterized protein LOC121306507 [Polyodon spathula]|uniref:uncharacterized protein LOC121306507 n=1 Tax=Polyodon spathula TaxID=7913 RepID=UPI001B7EFA7A|nr:uncharacterized protein LOC121306507 [Polyodon spathula]